MTIFNVHVYREMRLVFEGIEAETHEGAASIARHKPTGDADDIAECEGQNLAALVDVVGDQDFGESRIIDFEPEQKRQAAAKLLDAPEISEGFIQWSLHRGADRDATSAAPTFIRTTIAEAESVGITSQPVAPRLLMALKAVLPYAENERASLQECWERDDDPKVKEELDVCDQALDQANAAIAQARTASLPSEPPFATQMYDTLSYVAEILSALKPDFLRNVGFDLALEKCLAALRAVEGIRA
jgi:hypothetical protein